MLCTVLCSDSVSTGMIASTIRAKCGCLGGLNAHMFKSAVLVSTFLNQNNQPHHKLR